MSHCYVCGGERTCDLERFSEEFAGLIYFPKVPERERGVVADRHLWIEGRPGLLLCFIVLKQFCHPFADLREFANLVRVQSLCEICPHEKHGHAVAFGNAEHLGLNLFG